MICESGNEYIIKKIRDEAKPQEQIASLENSSKNPRIEKFVYPNTTNGLQFIFPSNYISFHYKEKDHFLAILPKAQGEVLYKMVVEFSTDANSQIIKTVGQAYFDIGVNMAHFYKELGTLDNTVVHGSLHTANMCYDAKSRLVTLIDNDGIDRSLEKPRDIGRDLATLFAVSPIIISFSFDGFLDQLDLERWYTIVLSSFIFGFLSTYKETERKDIFSQLKNLLFKWDTYFQKETIKQVKKMIKEVLVNLELQYIKQNKTEFEIIEANPDLEILKYLILEKESA